MSLSGELTAAAAALARDVLALICCIALHCVHDIQAASDPHALLLFSGGETRRDAGPRSEGASYWQVADAGGWYGSPEVRQRAATEESARDSYENVMFGLCRFYQLTGHYPESVTVVRSPSPIPPLRLPTPPKTHTRSHTHTHTHTAPPRVPPH